MRHREKKIYTQNNLDEVSTLYKDFILKEIDSKKLRIKNRYIEINNIEYFNSRYKELSPLLDKESEHFLIECSDYMSSLDALENESYTISNEEADNNNKHNEIITDYDFQAEIIKDLLLKIKDSVEIIAAPLSGEIFELKKGCNSFTRSFINWKEEMTDEDSVNNYHKVVSSFQSQSENFKILGSEISKDFQNITGSLNEVSLMFNRISDDTTKIEDIASNIKTLSINASIEAARAGVHGKGFKVIATGTQNLSEQTNTLLDSIVNTVKETKKIIETTESSLIKQSQTVVSQIDNQITGYQIFYNVLQEFYSKFEIVFDDVTNGTKETFKHIDKVMPMIQLHDGIEQQLGNIAEMILKLNKIHSTDIFKILEDSTEQEIKDRKNSLITNFEDQITTDVEVEVLSSIVNKYNLIREKKLEIINDDIELF